MTATVYENWTPTQADQRHAIAAARAICEDYAEQGYNLTLRQVYYQFVARDLFPAARRYAQVGKRWVRDPDGTPNAEPNYKWLGDVLAKARMAGLLDWDYLTDRTRNLAVQSTWSDPEAIVRTIAYQYKTDHWRDQPTHIEVWVEKEALAEVVGRAARSWQVPYFACRGYVSLSEMHAAAQRMGEFIKAGKRVVILHLGDHDPSGIDMTRDIKDRLDRFTIGDWAEDHDGAIDWGGYEWEIDVEVAKEQMAEHVGLESWEDALEVRRIALNMDQIRQYNPPPNPAKLTDSRGLSYVAEYGEQSWELDALEPAVMAGLIDDEVAGLVDMDRLMAVRDGDADVRTRLQLVSSRWADVVDFIDGPDLDPPAYIESPDHWCATCNDVHTDEDDDS